MRNQKHRVIDIKDKNGKINITTRSAISSYSHVAGWVVIAKTTYDKSPFVVVLIKCVFSVFSVLNK